MDTVTFTIEIDRYFEVYSENAEISASKNPYSRLIRNTDSSEYELDDRYHFINGTE